MRATNKFNLLQDGFKMEEEKKDTDTPPQIQKSLRDSITEGSFWGIMAGFGDSYLTAFATALKLTASQISYLITVPLLISSLGNYFSPLLDTLTKTRKALIVPLVLAQAFVLIPMIFVPYVFTDSMKIFISLMFLYCAFRLFGSLCSPPWTSWMGDIVPEKIRGEYFGKRNRVIGVVQFASLGIAGYLLHIIGKIDVFIAYAVIFSIAALGRFLSGYMFTRTYEPLPQTTERRELYRFQDFVQEFTKTDFGYFSLYNIILYWTVYISSPFFSVYWLNELHISYLHFGILQATAAITSFATIMYWGKHADRFGNKKVLEVSSLLINLIPFLMLLGDDWYLFIPTQMIAGFSWAGFNLAAFNYLYDTVEPPKRSAAYAYLNIFKGVSIFWGGVVGTLLFQYWEGLLSSKAAFLLIFFISGVLRLVSAFSFLDKFAERKSVDPIRKRDIILGIFVPLRFPIGMAVRFFSNVSKK